MLCKKGALKISQILQENTYVGVSFDKAAGLQAFIFLKRDFNTVAFMWTLRNLKCFSISDIQTTNNVIYTLAENFSFNFKNFKTFSYLLCFANFRSTEFVFAFAFFSHTISTISHNISNVSFFSSLNRLNAFTYCQKFVLFGNTQNLSSGLIRIFHSEVWIKIFNINHIIKKINKFGF